LSEAKAEKVEAIVKKYRKEQRTLSKDMREARRELRELFRNDSDDQQAYQKALSKLNAANKKLQTLRDKQFAELSQSLTPKEQARLLAALHKLRQHVGKRERRRGWRPPRGPRGPRGPRRPKNPGF